MLSRRNRPSPWPVGDRLIDDNEVAEAFGITRRTVYLWVKKGLIPRPVVQRPRYTRWSFNQIQAHIAAMVEAERKERTT